MKRIAFASAVIAACGIGAALAQQELSPSLATMNADNATFYTGRAVYPAGAAGNSFHPMGVVYTLPAPVATGTGTGAQTLGTYTLPANAFDVAGRKLRVTAAFTTAANTNNKTCTLNFGGAGAIITTGAMAVSGETATLQMTVTKTASNVQTVWATGNFNTTLIKPVVTTGSETDTAAIAILAVCTDGTSSAGDATLQDFYVEYMN